VPTDKHARHCAKASFNPTPVVGLDRPEKFLHHEIDLSPIITVADRL
jgi:hypothetical protein